MFRGSDPARLRARAEELERKGKRERALETYRGLAQAEPYDPELWLLLGSKEIGFGQPGRAAGAFFRAPDILLRIGLLTEALDAAKRTLEVDRNHGAARRLRGIIERRLRLTTSGPEPDGAPPAPKVIVELEAEEPPPSSPSQEPVLTVEAE